MHPGLARKQRLERDVATNRFADSPADERRANGDDDGITRRRLDHQGTAKSNQRNTYGQPPNRGARCPLAAAATAIALYRPRTRSAIRIVRAAAINPPCCLVSPSPSCPSLNNRTPIHHGGSPPMVCRQDIASSLAATTVSAMRSTTAVPEPKNNALRRCSGGKTRAASAMTTALSPDRSMFIQAVLTRPIQNPALCGPTHYTSALFWAGEAPAEPSGSASDLGSRGLANPQACGCAQ